MLILRGPAPIPTVDLYLPNPDLGDGIRSESRVALKKMMDGEHVTYVTRRPNKFTRSLSFDVTYMKALEFWAFCDQFLSSKIIVIEDVTPYTAVLLLNPLTVQPEKRAVVAGSLENVRLNFDVERV
jgi:hypothetical protein